MRGCCVACLDEALQVVDLLLNRIGGVGFDGGVGPVVATAVGNGALMLAYRLPLGLPDPMVADAAVNVRYGLAAALLEGLESRSVNLCGRHARSPVRIRRMQARQRFSSTRRQAANRLARCSTPQDHPREPEVGGLIRGDSLRVGTVLAGRIGVSPRPFSPFRARTVNRRFLSGFQRLLNQLLTPNI